MIKTSVIVPVYNVEEYLEECLESIFQQTQKEIEVIAVNDGSTDSSLSILEQIESKESRLHIITQENHGLGYARNVGLEYARGKYVYFIDSDDYLNDATALEQCYACAESKTLDLVAFDAVTFGEMGVGSDNNYNRIGILPENIVMSGMEMLHTAYSRGSLVVTAYLWYADREFLKKHNLKFPIDMLYEDTSFYCELMAVAKRTMYLPHKYYSRRYRQGSITISQITEKNCKSYSKVADLIYMIYENNRVSEYEIFRELAIGLWGSGLELSFLADQSETIVQIRENIWHRVIEICIPENEQGNYQCQNILFNLVYRLEKKGFDTGMVHQAQNYYIKLFADIPLCVEGAIVGIYGTGRYTERFLELYEAYVGIIKAKIFFIDSYKMSGALEYYGRSVYNIDDLAVLKPDCILISSSRYEDEMYSTVKEHYGDAFRIVCLKGELGF